jgi:hypothetical protein
VNKEPEAEHREVPKEEAVTMSVGRLRKRRRDRNLAAKRRQKPKDGSWRKSAAARRGTTRRAKVAWRKGIIFRCKWTRSKVERATRRVGPLRKNLRTHHEGRRGTKDLGGQRPLYLRKKRATAIGIGRWSSRQLSPLGRRTDLQDPRAEIREASKRDVQRVTKNDGPDTMEQSTTYESEKKKLQIEQKPVT